MGFLERLKDGLSKTRRNFTDRIEELVGMSAKVDEDFLEELEMILLSGDVGVKAAIARNVDVLFIDTAGRLHNKTNLMNELEKVHRIIKREIPEAPHETFLVLDATTGQNAINQAKVFMETANVTGVVLTKLDGTAKGGVVIAIKEELGLPVKWIGVGEGIMDFRPFEADKFVDALFDGDK